MKPAGQSAFSVSYQDASVATLLGRHDTLAVLDFDRRAEASGDPRHLRVPLPPLNGATPRECWNVDAAVASGIAGDLRWAAGGGWRLITIEVDEVRHGGIETATELAYSLLLAHVATHPEKNLLRIWNYLGAINAGAGDHERYRLFCNGRARGMAAHGIDRYPAATAIGHHGPEGLLQVYALCAAEPGKALENPRQVNAWQYPRQYGPTSPSFARAMQLPGTALAISGTAAITGHASRHHDDVSAQAEEAFANLHTLLDRAGLPAFDAHSPLKVYVRHAQDVSAIEAALAGKLDPAVPRILLHGDICRSELLVEIDGWRFAP